jgi:hypothetical protein
VQSTTSLLVGADAGSVAGISLKRLYGTPDRVGSITIVWRLGGGAARETRGRVCVGWGYGGPLYSRAHSKGVSNRDRRSAFLADS